MQDDAVLDAALHAVNVRGEEDYGDVLRNFELIAELWTAFLQRQGVLASSIEPDDVALMMILLKVARESVQHKADNLVDIAGYAEITGRLLEHLDREAEVPTEFNPAQGLSTR